jgi:transposase-like protein
MEIVFFFHCRSLSNSPTSTEAAVEEEMEERMGVTKATEKENENTKRGSRYNNFYLTLSCTCT